jgi:ferric-dicitrate binding protein FerR (iron transport regulator)
MASRDLLLQKLHDGELPAAEADLLRAQLSDEERQKLLALAELDEALATTLHTEAEAHSVDLWAGIAQKLDKLDAPGAVKASAISPRRRWMLPATALVSALAMAAALALLLWPRPRTTNHCDIERLEVAGSSATVLSVPDDHGSATTLIWMDHQETDEWESL